MKELSIEEKAKAYDIVLDKIKRLLGTGSNCSREELEYVFPELAESGDERTKKEILDYIIKGSESLYDVQQYGREKFEKWIAWLEKQGKNNMGISEATKQKLEDNLNKALEKETPESWNKFLDEQGEQKSILDVEIPFGTDSELVEEVITIPDGCYAIIEDNKVILRKGEKKSSWSEEDEYRLQSCLNILQAKGIMGVTETINTKWLKSLKDRIQSQKQEWKQENTDDLTDFENAMMHIGGSFFGENAGLDPNDTNVIKEQANLLLELIPKKEWSEEDEYNYLLVLGIIREDPDSSIERKNRLHSWLKSLRPQNTWKPSDEQIEALDFATDCIVPAEFCFKRKELKGLLEQLKKLKG